MAVNLVLSRIKIKDEICFKLRYKDCKNDYLWEALVKKVQNCPILHFISYQLF